MIISNAWKLPSYIFDREALISLEAVSALSAPNPTSVGLLVPRIDTWNSISPRRELNPHLSFINVRECVLRYARMRRSAINIRPSLFLSFSLSYREEKSTPRDAIAPGPDLLSLSRGRNSSQKR